MHLPQSQSLHRITGFARFFHYFLSVLLLHSGHTSKLQFFHCFSIVSRVLYAIMVPHRSLKCSIVFPSYQFPSFYSYFTWRHFRPTSEPQFFHCVSIVLLHFFIIVPRFFHCFSIANGLTSKPHFFHCFSIVLLNIIFPSIPVSPVFFHNFSSNFTQSSHSLRDVSIHLSFQFIIFSSVLPWCYSISPSLPLCYLSVSNAYPNAPLTIPTVVRYNRFCSFLPWFYFRASTP